MVVEEDELWPTWLYIPAVTTRVNELVATIRICGLPGENYRYGFCQADGGPPRIIWAFWNLLTCFLNGGPRAREIKHDVEASIKSLVIDIRTPDVPIEMIAPIEVKIEGEPYLGYYSYVYKGLQRLREDTGYPYVMVSYFEHDSSYIEANGPPVLSKCRENSCLFYVESDDAGSSS
ncbi:hypothetical protein ONS96_010906 [Cadophora gregata f. sp. sojae]|nr:hypothetical protein ONS96_010906 [Cadophora gregata f. sp. sojae]